MKRKIILVGCGEIGSRHLQALAKLSKSTDIKIIEPNESAVITAKQRMKEVSDYDRHSFFWYNSIEQIEKDSDLVIVSTTAKNRVDILCNLLGKGHKKFFIEKMVCQSISEYETLMSELKKRNAKCWVNLARRYFPIYQEIKQMISQEQPIQISIIAGGSGLGTNSIHYLDLFTWLDNDDQISLDGTYLHNNIFPNKRGKNLVEFYGTIIGKTKKGSSINITFVPDSISPIIVNIKNKNDFLVYDEYLMKFFIKDDEIQHENFKYEHVSSTTTKIVEDILEKDSCLLPNLNNLYYIHSELFRIFNDKMKKITGETISTCPIT